MIGMGFYYSNDGKTSRLATVTYLYLVLSVLGTEPYVSFFILTCLPLFHCHSYYHMVEPSALHKLPMVHLPNPWLSDPIGSVVPQERIQ